MNLHYEVRVSGFAAYHHFSEPTSTHHITVSACSILGRDLDLGIHYLVCAQSRLQHHLVSDGSFLIILWVPLTISDRDRVYVSGLSH